MRLAVVGHVEWIDFARVPHVPRPGDIVQASQTWEEAGGGGAVAAVQLARLGGAGTLYTALGDDALGKRAAERLRELGLELEVAWRGELQRRAFVHVDDDGERTITVMGEKLRPRAAEPLAWDRLAGADAAYFTGGDADALRQARRARVLVATARELPTLQEAGVALDALVASGKDEGERYRPGDIEPAPRMVFTTLGDQGGTYTADGREESWAPAPLPGAPVDAYGSGDSFAGGLTFALGKGLGVGDALALAARCGATCLTGRGPYGRQLTGADL